MDSQVTYERTLEFLRPSNPPDVRGYAINLLLTLANEGNSDALNQLIETLSDRNWNAQKGAISAAGKLDIYGDFRKLNKIMTIWRKTMRALDHSEIEVRNAAKSTLEIIVHNASPIVLKRLEEALENPVIIPATGYEKKLLRLMRTRLEDLRAESCLKVALHPPKNQPPERPLERLKRFLLGG